MSGWHSGDKMLSEDADDDFPQMNNITVPGIMPHDQIPAPGTLSPTSNALFLLFSEVPIYRWGADEITAFV